MYLHEHGSVHQIRILEDLSNESQLGYRIEIVRALKPTFYGQEYYCGQIIELRTERKSPNWRIKTTP